MLAGIWNEWTDPATGELVPSFTMLTVNCDSHPLLARLHKPDPTLPSHAQDKRALVHVEPELWDQWLSGERDEARRLLVPAPMEMFDLADAVRTDAALVTQGRAPSLVSNG